MNSDMHAQLVDLLPAFALGCLDEDEAEWVSEHLIICAECRETFKTYQAVVEDLPLAGCTNAPPPQLRRRLLQKVNRQQEEGKEPNDAGDSGWPAVPRVAPIGASLN
ncbi:MAG: anti-sigma factor family protein [Anaerolineae bacterium]